MPFFDSIRIGASGTADSEYLIDKSLRFHSGNANYLINSTTRTVATAAYSLSLWVKLGTLSSSIVWIAGGMNSSGANNSLGGVYYYQNKFYWYHYSGADSDAAYTNGMIRDPSAWYHILISKPVGSNGTFYLNGVAQTKQTASSYEVDMFSGNLLIGAQYSASSGYHRYFNGYIAEVNAIDGTALTPSSFTETNSDTGQLVPKKYTGSYGSRGFYLNFSNSSSLGTDYSGNGENFTANNFTVSGTTGNALVLDTPTNNFPVLNPLNINPYASSGYPSATFGKGNTRFTTNTTSQVNYAESSVYYPSTGKWYLEVVVNNLNIGSGVGYLQGLTLRSSTTGSRYLWWVYASPYYQINTESGLITISSISNGDILQVAYDSDTGKAWYGKNNTWYFSGDPANGTAMSNPITMAGDDVRFLIQGRSGSAANIVDVNFGAGGFAYTPPSGFKSLASRNLPDPVIKIPKKHFGTILYTGDNTDGRDVTDSSAIDFTPDWVWHKARDAGSNNFILVDSVRGATKLLFSNSNASESIQTDSLSAFITNGFTVSDNTAQADMNSSSHNYVAWCWNGGEADSKTYKVKVVADSTDYGHGTGSNKYQFFKSDGSTGFGTNGVDLNLEEGGTYIFDWSDSSAQSHPIRFSLTNDGTHSSGTSAGTEYTTGVTKDDSAYKTTITIASGVANLFYYCQNHSGMGAEINTNSTKGSTNFDGDVTSIVKANTPAGFSIVSWTIPATANYNVGHGLGAKPDVVITKNRNYTYNWWTFTDALDGTSDYFALNSTNGAANAASFGVDLPTTTTFEADDAFNGSSQLPMIAYCISSVEGYSKVGKYVGDGSTSGAFVHTGFRPAWILLKRNTNTYFWIIVDDKRDSGNPTSNAVFPQTSSAEATGHNIDFLTNGFKLRLTGTAMNAATYNYFYVAFADSPYKFARPR